MKILTSHALINKCSDRNMEVKLPAFLGNYQRQIDRSTDRRTDWVIGKFHLPKVRKMLRACLDMLQAIRLSDLYPDPDPFGSGHFAWIRLRIQGKIKIYYQTMHIAYSFADLHSNYFLFCFCGDILEYKLWSHHNY